MAEAIKMGGGGLKVTNGKLEEYYAYGDKIKAQTFVEKYHNTEYSYKKNNTTLDYGTTNNSITSLFRVSDDIYLITYGKTLNADLYACLIKYNKVNNELIYGTPLLIESIQGSQNSGGTVRLDDTHIAISSGYTSGSGIYFNILKLDLQNLTITILKRVACASGVENYYGDVVRLDDNHFVVLYSYGRKNMYARMRIGTISGSNDDFSLTFGTIISPNTTYNSTRQIVKGIFLDNYLYCISRFGTDNLIYDVYTYDVATATLTYLHTNGNFFSGLYDVQFNILKINENKFIMQRFYARRLPYSRDILFINRDDNSYTLTASTALTLSSTYGYGDVLHKAINRMLAYGGNIISNLEINPDNNLITVLKDNYTIESTNVTRYWARNYDERTSIFAAIYSSDNESIYTYIVNILDRMDIKPASSNIYGITKTPATPTKRGKIYSLYKHRNMKGE